MKMPSTTFSIDGKILGVHTPGGPFTEPADPEPEPPQTLEGASYGVNFYATQIPPPGNKAVSAKTLLALDYYRIVAQNPDAEPNDVFAENFRPRHHIRNTDRGNALFVDGSVRSMDLADLQPDLNEINSAMWNMP